MDLVVIDCKMDDETYWVSPPMERWIAEMFWIPDIAIWGRSPVPGKQVRELLLIPREPILH